MSYFETSSVDTAGFGNGNGNGNGNSNGCPRWAPPVLDLHGVDDRVVPANVSEAANGWYFTPVAQIFQAWAAAAGFCVAMTPAPYGPSSSSPSPWSSSLTQNDCRMCIAP